MSHAALIIAGLAGLVVLAVVLKYAVRWMGFPCQFCVQKVSQFVQLPPQEQESILRYFREHEGREPDRSGLFVCTHCRTVHDDFSGEKASRDADRYGCRTFCKVCGGPLRNCEPGVVVICRNCHTPHEWRVHEPSGYRFFMPPAGARVLDRCPSDATASAWA